MVEREHVAQQRLQDARELQPGREGREVAEAELQPGGHRRRELPQRGPEDDPGAGVAGVQVPHPHDPEEHWWRQGGH